MNPVQNNSYEKLKSCLYSCKKAFYITLFFSFISNLMMLALPLYSLQVLDRVISSGNLNTLLMLTIIVVISTVVYSLMQGVRSNLLSKLGSWIDKKLSKDMFAYGIASSAQKKPISGSQYLQDLNNIKTFFSGTALTTLLDAPWAIIFLIALFFMSYIYGFVTLIGGIILFIIAVINDKNSQNIIAASNEYTIKSITQTDIIARNAEVIEAMGMMNNITTHWQKIHDKSQQLFAKANYNASLYSGLSKLLRLLIQISMTGIGGLLVIKGDITSGTMIAAGIIAGKALAPFEQSIMSWKNFVTTKKSLVKLSNSLKTNNERAQTIQNLEVKGFVEAENLVFAPAGSNRPIIKSVSFKINPGEVLGIIGPSASGKSTLAKLLVGVWKANNGCVRLDHADIYNWQREDIAKYIGYLPQDIELFNGTVAENIARMNSDHDMKDVISAAKASRTHELILHLNNGYETNIGDEGAVLSAGQRQRVALARAFYGNPKLLILDEPNSNLDDAGDRALFEALMDAKSKGTTIIVISHRKNLLPLIDKILVMNEGTMSAFGKRDEILQQLMTPRQNMEVVS